MTIGPRIMRVDPDCIALFYRKIYDLRFAGINIDLAIFKVELRGVSGFFLKKKNLVEIEQSTLLVVFVRFCMGFL